MTDQTRDRSKGDKPEFGERGAPSQGGRSGGDLQRDIASRDEKKRAFERPAPVTRVRKSDEKNDDR